MSLSVQNANAFNIPFLTGAQVRQGFIDFFKSKGHTFVPSAPVVPHDDPTLLFTNAGMNQFKSLLLGENKDGLKRAANSQKCIRVSGKHNDLDEVGRDTYHHTFFEMLGNWSFGDYYKLDAITWAWELLTEVWKLPKDRLFVTVFRDDEDAEGIWQKHTDIEHRRIMRFAEKSNFWEMGDVGPCGPCSEIHFDIGDLATQEATYADEIEGVNGTNGRYIEIWNLVFMQFERLQSGELKPLKAKNVDTGMGFERIAAIIQGKLSNYESDIFRPVIDNIAELSGIAYVTGVEGTPHRVLADHIRALSFAIADGATPSNEGRGYVLRRILRRASRFARQQLKQREPFMCKLVPALAAALGEAYPELIARQDYIVQVIRAEEERFIKTLDLGLDRFAKVAQEVKSKNGSQVPGTEIFTLYDTYGFPVDLTGVLAEENGLTMDQDGYVKCMEEQRERARSAAKFDNSLASDEGWTLLLPESESEFIGYSTLTATVQVARYREIGDHIWVMLKRTPFYAEAGGQVGDTGLLAGPQIQLRVTDTVKILDRTVHKCTLIHGLLIPENFKGLVATVDAEKRGATFRNHSATHLLHAALRKVLGNHVQQQGSRVSPESLRFDFTHHQGITAAELEQVETLVNNQIREDMAIAQTVKGLQEARDMGAMALFGEKYGDQVRVIQMGDFSLELCGGTHARSTGQIGLLKVLGESSIASGVRRIEAVTGNVAVSLFQKQFHDLNEIARLYKAKSGTELEKAQEFAGRVKVLEKEILELKQNQMQLQAQTLLRTYGKQVGVSTVLIHKLDVKQFIKDDLSLLMDAVAGQLQNGIALLTHATDDNLAIIALVGKDALVKIKAGDLVKTLGQLADGKGGGRPDRAQAGSKSPQKEELVLREAEKLIQQALGV